MSRFLAKSLNKLEEYVPGEQPQDKKYIKLNTNESPFPPSPNVIKGISEKEVSDLRLYSDPTTKGIVEAIGKTYELDSKNILVTNGSDESLAFCFKGFFDSGDKIAFADITYGFYKVYGELFGLDMTVFPLDNEFRINLEDYEKFDGNVIIANPNANTGIGLTANAIEKLVASNVNRLVIVDEAYVDFGGETVVPLIKKYDNLVVIQTFSKSRNLAGARIGIAMASKEVMKDLNKVKYSFNPYNLNRLSIVAGRESMLDIDYFKKCVGKIVSTRENFKRQLTALGFSYTNSVGNFVLAKHSSLKGQVVYNELRNRGILVRYFGGERLGDYVRITIGSQEEMDATISALKEIILL